MHAVLIVGSRNLSGQTAKAIDAFALGMANAGASCETVFLPRQKLEHCRQCKDNGWGTCLSDGCCQIHDDFSLLVQKIREADAVGFATPVYFGDLSESLRTFLDRLRRICRADAGKLQIAGKPAIGICVAGGGGGGAAPCSVSLEKTLQHCGFDVVDLIPVRRQNLEMKIGVLGHVGKWFATCPTSIPAKIA